MANLIFWLLECLFKFDKTQNHNEACHFFSYDGLWILALLIKKVYYFIILNDFTFF